MKISGWREKAKIEKSENNYTIIWESIHVRVTTWKDVLTHLVNVACKHLRRSHVFQTTSFTGDFLLKPASFLGTWTSFSHDLWRGFSCVIYHLIWVASFVSFRLPSASRPRVKGVAGRRRQGDDGVRHIMTPLYSGPGSFRLRPTTTYAHKFLHSAIAGSPFQRVRASQPGQGRHCILMCFGKDWAQAGGERWECGEGGNNG